MCKSKINPNVNIHFLDPPKHYQTSRFAVTVFIYVSNNDFLGKISYNYVILHSNIL